MNKKHTVKKLEGLINMLEYAPENYNQQMIEIYEQTPEFAARGILEEVKKCS